MAKSVYSLVLTDELVNQLDKVAYKKGISRSTMINNLIAEYLSFETPEKKFADVFAQMQKIMEQSESFRFVNQQSPSFASINSALSVRYNPTVKFTVELFKDNSKQLGELKVSLRSTNEQLINAINKFYWLWTSLENKFVGKTEYVVDGGKYNRKLVLPNDEIISGAEIGKIITTYVKSFSALLNMYFANLPNVDEIYPKIEEVYLLNLKKQSIILK